MRRPAGIEPATTGLPAQQYMPLNSHCALWPIMCKKRSMFMIPVTICGIVLNIPRKKLIICYFAILLINPPPPPNLDTNDFY